MTRLDAAIRRLQAQRMCLDAAVAQIAGKPGIVLELGLGNGRSYDHLRTALPDRQIFVLTEMYHRTRIAFRLMKICTLVRWMRC